MSPCVKQRMLGSHRGRSPPTTKKGWTLVCPRSDHRTLTLISRLAFERNGDGLVAPVERPQVAKAIGDVSADNSTTELRVEAALALGLFTEIDRVLTALSILALAQEESIDLRYAAFTSLERAGPAPESISLMRQISGDETLGNSARSVLSAWFVE